MTPPKKRSSSSNGTKSSGTTGNRPPDISETAFQKQIIELAKRCGWRVAHVSDSRKLVRRGDRYIPVPDADIAGFPDLVLVHPSRQRVIFAELKRRGGRFQQGQAPWLNDLRDAGAETYVWKPEHWGHIQVLLVGR